MFNTYKLFHLKDPLYLSVSQHGEVIILQICNVFQYLMKIILKEEKPINSPLYDRYVSKIKLPCISNFTILQITVVANAETIVILKT